ncbi:unnamed protein product, partial [Musa textilis]
FSSNYSPHEGEKKKKKKKKKHLRIRHMGIQNLLRFLKPFIGPVHIRKYAGKRVGIDAYSWLHKGAYSCSLELCLDMPGEAARRYLNYFMHHINLLRHYNIMPVVVFDGGNIPCKFATEHERHRQHNLEANFELAQEKLKQGNTTGAIELFQKAVRVTPLMAHKLIQILRSEDVEFIVAPYEADAQLAYLSSLKPDQGGIAAVITEDSDLIAYGCQAIIFKMDRYGNGEEILMDRVFKSASDGLSFKDFDKELLTGMCVLAGCDFLPSIPGIGIKRAYSFVSKYKNLDRVSPFVPFLCLNILILYISLYMYIYHIFHLNFLLATALSSFNFMFFLPRAMQVLSVLRLDKRYKMPEDYCKSFRKAVAVFHHARVYDMATRALKHLKPLEEKHLEFLNGDLDLLGPELPQSVAAAVAEGKLNPITMQQFDCLPKVEMCSESVSVLSYYRTSGDELRISFTEESCITMCSSEQDHEEHIEDKLVVAREAALDQKYIKEAFALGMLVAPAECHQVMELEVDKASVPDNNPFKKRKLEKSSSQEDGRRAAQAVVTQDENSLGTVCSSPQSQESVESKPKKSTPIGKEKTRRRRPKTKSENKSAGIKKNGILKFFQPL